MKKVSVAFFTAILFILCFMSGSFIAQKSDSRNEGQETVRANDDVSIKQDKQQAEETSEASTTEPVRKDMQEHEVVTETVAAANSNKVEDTCRYIMKYENNHIIVYEADGITIFEETDIDQSHLSEQMLVKLKEGLSVSDEETLYSLLESFSS